MFTRKHKPSNEILGFKQHILVDQALSFYNRKLWFLWMKQINNKLF